MTPVAGSLPERAADADRDATSAPHLVLNETAVRRLGFSSARAAVGQTLPMPSPNGPRESAIIGVVPDLSLASVEHAVQPMVYFSVPSLFNLMSVKLTGE